MKRLILFELLVLFLATTFESDSPPGWYQQSIPIGNKLITDIQFLDSLNGWVVTDWGPAFDTGYVFKTSDGGNNWNFQYRFHGSFTAIQMTSNDTGYITGSTGSGKVWKTTNGGTNWNIQFNFGANPIWDLAFVSSNTGWVCSDDPISGGIFKTTNGGLNWQTQLGASFSIKKIFFINNDTGWAGSNEANGKIYITTNGGTNWSQRFNFFTPISNLFFINYNTGFVSGNFVPNSIRITTNGGFNWDSTSNSQGGIDIYFVNSLIGYNCANFSIVQKTTNGGISWFRQTVPNGFYSSIHFPDTSNGWSGGTILIHTTDGGGPPVGITKISSEIPINYKLFQNFPNPFNPETNIKYQIVKGKYVKLIVFDVTGKEIAVLVNEEQRAGTYQAAWNAEGVSSGIYFYSLIIDGKLIDTKKMILIK
ncbi:MAG: T9SS type A sorting domain-containing protein [Chlorobi bacterium]|nr:T9SS type A sorting domain-containing protein [Chlorobiota bacterium]MCI0715818.1 T9SS type A sorting domain-containing protein [Chlorobiota bacterium]